MKNLQIISKSFPNHWERRLPSGNELEALSAFPRDAEEDSEEEEDYEIILQGTDGTVGQVALRELATRPGVAQHQLAALSSVIHGKREGRVPQRLRWEDVPNMDTHIPFPQKRRSLSLASLNAPKRKSENRREFCAAKRHQLCTEFLAESEAPKKW